eukprot:2898416-Ditylum_brightwellii.AAC.1
MKIKGYTKNFQVRRSGDHQKAGQGQSSKQGLGQTRKCIEGVSSQDGEDFLHPGAPPEDKWTRHVSGGNVIPIH